VKGGLSARSAAGGPAVSLVTALIGATLLIAILRVSVRTRPARW